MGSRRTESTSESERCISVTSLIPTKIQLAFDHLNASVWSSAAGKNVWFASAVNWHSTVTQLTQLTQTVSVFACKTQDEPGVAGVANKYISGWESFFTTATPEDRIYCLINPSMPPLSILLTLCGIFSLLESLHLLNYGDSQIII